MTEQLLFIDNKAMDINESTNITLNFRSNIFSDVSKITSNNTYSIKLPLTVNNCHVINMRISHPIQHNMLVSTTKDAICAMGLKSYRTPASFL